MSWAYSNSRLELITNNLNFGLNQNKKLFEGLLIIVPNKNAFNFMKGLMVGF